MQRVPYYQNLLLCLWDNMKLEFQTPSKENTKYFESKCLLPSILINTSWLNFFSIFSALLNEKSMIFVCESREKLSNYISCFISLLKPFVWEFPVIYFLDKKNYGFLDSPVPLIVGVDASSEQFKFKKEHSNVN